MEQNRNPINNDNNNYNEKNSTSLNPSNQWIINLLQRECDKQIGPQRNAYIRAIRSLQQCPSEIINEHRALAVPGIGPSFARKIKKQLQRGPNGQNHHYIPRYVKETPLQAKAIVQKQYNEMAQNEEPKSDKKKRKTPRKKPKKPYIPPIGTGDYAILIYMYEADKNDGIQQFTKNDLKHGTKQYTDTSFNEIWKSMPLLIKYDYVKPIRYGNTESIYCLQEAGKQIAAGKEITISIFNTFALNHEDQQKKDNFICPYCDRKYVREQPFNQHIAIKHPNGQNAKVRAKLLEPYQYQEEDHNVYNMNNNCRKRKNDDMIELDDDIQSTKRQRTDVLNHTVKQPIKIDGEWYDLYLVYDTTEERTQCSNERVTLEHQFNCVEYINSKQCRLSIGDFCWILKSIDDPNKEYLYPIIVERKRMDDLVCSIQDKRYCEQKWRIKKSIPHFRHIYLIEEFQMQDELKKKQILQSVINTEVGDRFFIYHTNSLIKTIRVLSTWTRMIYQKILNECTGRMDHNGFFESQQMLSFGAFNKSMDNKKNLSISAKTLFGRQLMSVCGVTDVIAYAITTKYQTMRQLYNAWDHCDNDQQAKLLLHREIVGTYLDYHRNLDSGLIEFDQDLSNVYGAMSNSRVELISKNLSEKIWIVFYHVQK